MNEVAEPGKKMGAVWRNRSECEGRGPRANEITSVWPVIIEGKTVLWVEQSVAPDYLYDPETNKYAYVSLFEDAEDDHRQVVFRDYFVSPEENKLLEERLAKLVE